MKPKFAFVRRRLSRRLFLPGILPVALALALSSKPARAVDGSWAINNTGNWSATGSWTGGIIADGASSTATFNLDITADRTATLDGNRTIGNLFFRDTATGSNSWVIGGTANTLTLDDGANKPTISIHPRTNAIIARIDRPVAGTNGFEVVAPAGAASMALGNIANTFSGTVTVGAGASLRTDNNDSLGTRDALTTVATSPGDPAVVNFTQVFAGGTLNLNNKNLGTEYVKVEGVGWDGNGALVNLGADQQNALQQVELTGNTTFGGSGRWDIRTGGTATGRLFQNGFTITKTSANQISLVGVNVIGGGDININQGVFAVETSTILGGSGTVNVNTGGSFNFWANNGSMTRAVNMNGGGMNHPNTTATATYAGNVALSATNTNITQAGTGNLIFTGSVSGSGGLTKLGTGTLQLNGANSFTGATTISAGALRLGTTPLASQDITITSGAILNTSPLVTPQIVGNTLTVGRTGTAATDITGSITLGAGADLELGTSARNAGTAVERTATISGDLSLAGGGVAYYDLGATAAGLSDTVAVGGSLELLGTTDIHVTPSGGGLGTGSYKLMSYATTLTGSAANLTLSGVPATTRQTFTLSTTTVANQVTLDVAGSAGALTWVGNGTDNNWDLNGTSTFDNSGSADTFRNLDSVTFGDTGSTNPAVNLIGTLEAGVVTVNSSQNYTFSGAGILAGGTTLSKQGTGSLTIPGTGHTFTGAVTVSGGTLAATSIGNAGGASSLGSGNNITIQGGILSFIGTTETSNKTINVGTGGAIHIPTAGSVLTLNSATAVSGAGDLTVTGAGALRFSRDDASFTLATPLAGNGNVRLNPRTVAGSTTGLDVTISGDNTDFSGNLILESPGTGTWRTAAAVQNRLGTSDVVVQPAAQLWVSGAVNNDMTITGSGYAETNGTNMGALRLDNATINGATLTVAGAAKIGAHNSTGTLSGVTLRGATTGGGDDILTVNGTNFGNDYSIVFTGTVDDTTLDKIIVGGGGTTGNAQNFQVGNLTASGNLGNVPIQIGSDAQQAQLRFHQSNDYVVPTTITTGGTNAQIHANTPAGTTNGKGLVIGSGSTLNLAYLGVGTGAIATGTTSKLTIESGANITAGLLHLGDQDGRTGNVTQSGGDVTVTNHTRIGHWPNNSSTYTMTGGTLTYNGVVGGNPSGTTEQAGGIYLGVDGSGSFSQSGGAVNTGFVVLDNRGDTAAGVDTYTLNGGTLTVTSTWGIIQRNASTAFNLGGGTIIAGANMPFDTAATLTAATTSTIDTAGFVVTAPRAFSGSGNLDVTGGGFFTVTGTTSTASGALDIDGNTTLNGNGIVSASVTTVNSGSTILPGGTLGFTGGVIFDAGATLDVAVSSATAADKINAVGSITSNGAIKVSLTGYTPVGGEVYDIADFASFSGTPAFDFTDATLPGGLTWNTSSFATDGTIKIDGGNPYAAFESANGITGAGADADSDNDGIPNGIEFVIGGDPSGPGSDSNALRPTIVNTDPVYVDFIFRRTDSSALSDPYVQYGSTLAGWTDAEPGLPGGNPVVIDETNDHFGPGIDRVTVRIPRALAVDQKLFARLRVDIP